MPTPELPHQRPHRRLRGSIAPVLLGLLLLVLVGLIGFGVFLGKQRMDQLQVQLGQSEQHVQELESRNQELTAQLGKIQDDRKTLDDQLGALQGQLSSAMAEVDETRNSLKQLQHRYEELDQQRGELQSQVATLTTQRDSAQERSQQLDQQREELERSSSRLHERLGLLERDYRQAMKQVEELTAAQADAKPSDAPAAAAAHPDTSDEADQPPEVVLPPVTVNDQSPDSSKSSTTSPSRSTALHGRVLEVNDPQGFIVLDKGSEHGVRSGMVFDIIRGTTTIARATAVSVRPRISALDVVRTKSTVPVLAGDMAVHTGS